MFKPLIDLIEYYKSFDFIDWVFYFSYPILYITLGYLICLTQVVNELAELGM